MLTLLLLSLLVGLLVMWEYIPHNAMSRRGSRRPMRVCGLSQKDGLSGSAVGLNRERYRVPRRMVDEAVQAYMACYSMGRSEAELRAHRSDSWIFQKNTAVGFYL
jgi:hypothetical protein